MNLDEKLRDLKLCKFVKKTRSGNNYCSITREMCNKFLLPEECDLNKSNFTKFLEKFKKNYNSLKSKIQYIATIKII